MLCANGRHYLNYFGDKTDLKFSPEGTVISTSSKTVCYTKSLKGLSNESSQCFCSQDMKKYKKLVKNCLNSRLHILDFN